MLTIMLATAFGVAAAAPAQTSLDRQFGAKKIAGDYDVICWLATGSSPEAIADAKAGGVGSAASGYYSAAVLARYRTTPKLALAIKTVNDGFKTLTPDQRNAYVLACLLDYNSKLYRFSDAIAFNDRNNAK